MICRTKDIDFPFHLYVEIDVVSEPLQLQMLSHIDHTVPCHCGHIDVLRIDLYEANLSLQRVHLEETS